MIGYERGEVRGAKLKGGGGARIMGIVWKRS